MRAAEATNCLVAGVDILPGPEGPLVVERCLRTHPEFELERAEPFMGLPGLRGLKGAQRLYPDLHACDGYFIARLRRAGP